LAAVSTVGIVLIAGIQVTTALKKGNNAGDQLAKTIVEIKNARKDTLSEVKSIRSEVLKELNTVRLISLNELKTDRVNALGEVKIAKKEAIKDLERIGGKSSGPITYLFVFFTWQRGLGAGHQMTMDMEKVPQSSMQECEANGIALKGLFEEVDYKCIKGVLNS